MRVPATFSLTRRGILTATVFLMMSTHLGAAQAAEAGAVVPLPARMVAAAQQYLPGVVGDPVPSFTIDPALASLKAGTRTFRIVSGDSAGKTEEHVVAAAPRDTTGADWRYRVGDRTVFLKLVPGESLAVVSEQDGDQGVITRYSPAQPLLIAGMNAGDQKTMTLNVQVYNLQDPSDLEHQGSLSLTLTYVGAYKVTVPAGTYDAALFVWDYKGKIGPATIDDIQARFVAPNVGLVAAAEKRDIAAMLIYNDNSKVGKVLAQP
ncbi:MAG: hypothetical protein MUE49_13835 [Rhodospirillales bacterium]|nr:hypothetical protein [Rhodospirillales bacterium]